MATYKKVMNKLDSYTPLGYSLCGVVIEVGAGAEEFKVGQLVAAAGNEYALHAEYNWIPVNLCAAVPRGRRPRARRVRHRGRDRHAGGAPRRAAARRDRPGHRPRADRPAGRPAAGRRGIRVVGLDMIEDRCRLAEQAGAVQCAAPDDEGLAAVGGRAGRAHQRPRRRPRVPGRGRLLQRAGGDRGQAGPGPGPGGRHRQDQAGPALERLLRQGTRRPVLPVLRAGPVRRPLRAGGHRLPGRLCPLDRAAQPGLLPGPAGGARTSRSRRWSPARSRCTTPARSTPT